MATKTQDAAEELELLRHEHENFKKVMGQRVAEAESKAISLTERLRRAQDEVMTGKSTIEQQQVVIRELEITVKFSKAEADGLERRRQDADNYSDQLMGRLQALQQAGKPLVNLLINATKA